MKRGISLGSSLSPLLEALYLNELDRAMERMNICYVRFMDDILVLANNKWTFRNAIRKVNTILSELKLEKAVNKTFVGKIERGFDFLGFYFNNSEVQVSKRSVAKFAERLIFRLYRAERIRGKTTKKGGKYPLPESISKYIQRWLKWIYNTYEKIVYNLRGCHSGYRNGCRGFIKVA